MDHDGGRWGDVSYFLSGEGAATDASLSKERKAPFSPTTYIHTALPKAKTKSALKTAAAAPDAARFARYQKRIQRGKREGNRQINFPSQSYDFEGDFFFLEPAGEKRTRSLPGFNRREEGSLTKSAKWKNVVSKSHLLSLHLPPHCPKNSVRSQSQHPREEKNANTTFVNNTNKEIFYETKNQKMSRKISRPGRRVLRETHLSTLRGPSPAPEGGPDQFFWVDTSGGEVLLLRVSR